MFIKSLARAIALCISITAGTSFAQSTYIGGSVGQSTNKQNTSATDFGVGSPQSTDQSDTGYKLFVGRQLNQSFSVEGGYLDLGQSRAMYGGTSDQSITVKNTAWFVALKGDLPLGAGFSAFGKVGAAYARSSSTINAACDANSTCTNTKNKLNAMYGVGLEYDITKTVSARLEYEEFGTFGNSLSSDGSYITGGTARTKPSLWSLGVAVAF